MATLLNRKTQEGSLKWQKASPPIANLGLDGLADVESFVESVLGKHAS
ncbi:MAG: hypothetical protein HYZ28_15650 [Myxococcales bacterium]|nr:hypothetical protein [Myxococcales bacterium]